MNERYKICKAEADNAAEFSKIAVAAYQHYTPLIGQPPAPMLANFSQHISQDISFALWQGDQIIGYAIVMIKQDGYWLENIAVHPDFQGRGFGQALIDAVEDFIAQQATSYQLYTNIVMTQNISWYQKIGFVKTKEVKEAGFHRLYFKKDFSA